MTASDRQDREGRGRLPRVYACLPWRVTKARSILTASREGPAKVRLCTLSGRTGFVSSSVFSLRLTTLPLHQVGGDGVSICVGGEQLTVRA